MKRCQLVAIFPLLVGLACRPGELEVRGDIKRTIGERVTLKLLQGDPSFSGKVTLVDATNRPFADTALAVATPDNRTLELTVPIEVAVGAARLDIQQQGSTELYQVPLEVSRIALTLDLMGKLETSPLPGSTVPRTEIVTGDAVNAISLAPSGGSLAVLIRDRIEAFAMSASPSAKLPSPVELPGATVIAATDDGAVLATEEVVVLLSFVTGATEQARFALPGVQALAIDGQNRRAAALRHCDTDSDLRPDADCLSLIELDGPSSYLGPEIKLDDNRSALQVALRADGSAAVVADDEKIYGILLDLDPPEISELRWPATASPVNVDRAPSSLGDIFAIGDAATMMIQIVGFDGRVLKPVGTRIMLPGPPAGVHFGRLIDLYAAVGDRLFRIDPYESEPTPIELPGVTSSPISALVVQH